MLLCADRSFYIGITSDLERRMDEHWSGIDPRCYTNERRPLKLVHATEFNRVEDAIDWEKRIKGWSRAKKRALIADDWSEIQRLAHICPSRSRS
jgi:putative endonuclease